MFQPNSLKAIRALNSSTCQQEPSDSKKLIDEIDQALKDLKQWKEQEKIDLKKQLNENQKQQSTFKSGYEDEDEIYEEVRQREQQIYNKVNQIKKELLKKQNLVPSYMSSQYKTNDVKKKLEESSKKLENLHLNDSNPQNLYLDENLENELQLWKESIQQLENIQYIDTKPNQMDLNQIRKEEKELEIKEQGLKNTSIKMKQEFEDLDQDIDEINLLLKQCGIK